jgi:S1-C subfamily serine protease
MRRSPVAAAALVASLAFGGAAGAQKPSSESSPQSPPVETPTGWLGVRLSDEGIFNESGDAFFERYPVVSNVDPGSPASKAGVLPGDMILTFNSHDMRGATLQLSNWMKPGAAFELRVRRNETVRLLRGVLGRRPEGWNQRIVVQVSPSEQLFLRRRTEERAQAGGLQRSGIRVQTGSMPPRLPSLLVSPLGLGSGLYPFAGAEFTALNSDLCDVLGVKPEGVFVANVIEGSIAREAGLRGGDVVVMADRIKIENPNDLVRAIRSAGDRSVTLQVIRKRKPQTITLKW